jgi:hypothetical protein
LATPLEYAFDIQVNLIFALIALHNFIRLYNGGLDIFEELDSNSEEEDEANNILESEDPISKVPIEMDKLRELLATTM